MKSAHPAENTNVREMQQPGAATLVVRPILTCQECRRSWLEPRERWRLYLTDDVPAEAVAYCPGCASREFDPD